LQAVDRNASVSPMRTPEGQESPGSTVRSSQEVTTMPQKEHLPSVSAKEQRMYEHIKESAQKSGRYGDRAEEVAARTVMKHHKEEGHKKGQ